MIHPDAIRARASMILSNTERTQRACAAAGLPSVAIEPDLVAAVERIANGDWPGDPTPLLDAAAAILDAHICGRQAMRPDPFGSETRH